MPRVLPLLRVFRCPIPALGTWGKLPMNCRLARIAATAMTLIGMGRRPEADVGFEAVRTAIGTALRSLHSNVLQEPLPDRIAELLTQLDQQLSQLDQQKNPDSPSRP